MISDEESVICVPSASLKDSGKFRRPSSMTLWLTTVYSTFNVWMWGGFRRLRLLKTAKPLRMLRPSTSRDIQRNTHDHTAGASAVQNFDWNLNPSELDLSLVQSSGCTLEVRFEVRQSGHRNRIRLRPYSIQVYADHQEAMTVRWRPSYGSYGHMGVLFNHNTCNSNLRCRTGRPNRALKSTTCCEGIYANIRSRSLRDVCACRNADIYPENTCDCSTKRMANRYVRFP